MRAGRLLILAALMVAPAWGQEDEAADDEGDHDDHDIEEDSLSVDQLRSLHGKFDQNGDGKVSLQEVMLYSAGMGRSIASKDIAAILDEIDTSKDGKLTLEEHLADIHNQADGGDEEEMKEMEARKKVEASKFMAADANRDGVLDLEEVPALFYPETHEDVLTVAVKQTMQQKDRDGDGKLSAQEFWETDTADGDGGDLSEEENSDFKKLDLDADGFLSLDELRAWESGRFHTEEAMRKLFELSDRDNDMHLTADELAEAREQIAASDAQYHLIEWVEHHEL